MFNFQIITEKTPNYIKIWKTLLTSNQSPLIPHILDSWDHKIQLLKSMHHDMSANGQERKKKSLHNEPLEGLHFHHTGGGDVMLTDVFCTIKKNWDLFQFRATHYCSKLILSKATFRYRRWWQRKKNSRSMALLLNNNRTNEQRMSVF